MRTHRILIAAATAALVAAPAAAQLPNASAAGLALGGNYTATSRGFAAVAWNPANLAMPGTGGFSLALLPFRGGAGLSPIGVEELAEFEGDTVPFAARQDWLQQIRDAGDQQGTAGFDISYLAFSIGSFGFQASTTAYGVMDIAPDAAEVILFGNAGEDGQLQDFDFAGSALDFALISTVGASFGVPLSLTLGPLPDQHFAVGATVKYMLGHVLISGQDMGSQLTGDPLAIDIDFPVIMPDTTDYDGIAGRGYGVDLGAAWQSGPFSVGVAVTNVINTFAWDESRMAYVPGSAAFDTDTSSTEFDMQPIEDAPQALRDRLADQGFTRTLSVGAAFRPMRMLTVTADVRRQVGEGLELGPRSHMGVGAELRLIPFVPLRAGLAAVSGGYQASAGLGLEVGPVMLNGALAHRSGDLGDDTMFMAALSFGAR